MRKGSSCFLSGMFLVAGLTSGTARGQETTELAQKAILTVVAESAITQVNQITERLSRDGDSVEEPIGLSASYTSNDFILNLYGRSKKGTEIRVTATGYSWNSNPANGLDISFAGNGALGKEPVRLNGTSTWFADADRVNMDFRLVTKFGDHSIWGWVLGAETIVGGTIGAAGAVVTANIAVPVVGAAATPWIAAAGALTGSGALIGISAASKDLLSSDQPPPSPARPRRPEPPQSSLLLAGEGKIFTAVDKSGSIFASFNHHILYASFKSESGDVQGKIINGK